ncbi:unnamed protein product, partial [Prorocentrum cordatum]
MDDTSDDGDLAFCVQNRTRDALIASQTEMARSKQPLARKGSEFRHLPAEWKSAFEASDKADCVKWIKYDTVTIPTDKVFKTIDSSEVLPMPQFYTDRNMKQR